MQVSSFLDLSKEFSAYSFEIDNTKLNINDETKTRAIINRLYYALFHRILPEINELKNKSGSSQHDAIYGILLKKVPNQEVTRLFNILKSLSVSGFILPMISQEALVNSSASFGRVYVLFFSTLIPDISMYSFFFISAI